MPSGNLSHFIYPRRIADASISWSTCNPVKHLMEVTSPSQNGNSWEPPAFHLSQRLAGPYVCVCVCFLFFNRICGSAQLNLLSSDYMLERRICCQAIRVKLRIYICERLKCGKFFPHYTLGWQLGA